MRIPSIILAAAISIAMLAACSKTLDIKTEKNQVQYQQEKAFKAKPSAVKQATERALAKLVRMSEKVDSSRVFADDNTVHTDWLYAASRDKYATVNFNGYPERKKLTAKTKYRVLIEPSVHGSLVKAEIKEEVEELHQQSGERVGWKSVAPETLKYQRLFENIQNALRQN